MCTLESCELVATAVSGTRCSHQVRKHGGVTRTAPGHRQDEAGPPLFSSLRVSSGIPPAEPWGADGRALPPRTESGSRTLGELRTCLWAVYFLEVLWWRDWLCKDGAT